MSLVKRGTWAKKDEVSQLSHSIYVCNQCGYMAEKKDSTGECPKCKIKMHLVDSQSNDK
jgi:rubrerythrin